MVTWIAGSNGMLGKHVVRLWEAKNLPFIANDVAELSITDEQKVLQFVEKQEISLIINCAAYTNVDQAEKEYDLAYQINVAGPQNLGNASRKFGIPVIHFSTDYVFNGLSTSPYEETDLCQPINAYGETKWLGEQKLMAETDKACIIRTSWLCGKPGKNFVETMLRLMQEREQLSVVNDQIGRPTFCEDLSKAAYALKNCTGIYHFANEGETSWYVFAQEIALQAKEQKIPLKLKNLIPITTQEYPTPAKRPKYSTLSTAKIEREGIIPRSWKHTLKEYLCS